MAQPLVSDIGHIAVSVHDMEQALRFYRDLLGFEVEGEENPAWTIIAMKGVRLTLYRQKEFAPVATGPARERRSSSMSKTSGGGGGPRVKGGAGEAPG